MFRRAVVVLVVGCAGFFAGARPAHSFPEGQVPKISCGSISIDPPSWIKVRFTGAVNGKPYDRTVFYAGGSNPHLAVADITDLTSATGPLHITSTATSPYLGTSPTSEVTITCHTPPTTTVAPMTSTTKTKTTATTAPASCTEPRGCCLAQCGGKVSPAQELPKTGSSSLPFGAVGTGAVGVGAALLALARRRKARTS